MKTNIEDVFVDTNVLVYAHDQGERTKQPVAKALLKELWENGSGVLSTQVLQEFYAVVTRKFDPPMSARDARELVAAYSEWCAVNTDPQLIIAASKLSEDYSVSWWDALIMEAALRSGSSSLLSEDLHDGQRFGTVVVRNPFLSG